MGAWSFRGIIIYCLNIRDKYLALSIQVHMRSTSLVFIDLSDLFNIFPFSFFLAGGGRAEGIGSVPPERGTS